MSEVVIRLGVNHFDAGPIELAEREGFELSFVRCLFAITYKSGKFLVEA